MKPGLFPACAAGAEAGLEPLPALRLPPLYPPLDDDQLLLPRAENGSNLSGFCIADMYNFKII